MTANDDLMRRLVEAFPDLRPLLEEHLLVDRLLADIEEEFEDDAVLGLYMFAWSLAGLGVSRADPDFAHICRTAFEEFRSRHPDLVLVWVNWPIDLADARPVEAGTPIDLDLDPDAPVDTPLLVLVPPDTLRPSVETLPGSDA